MIFATITTQLDLCTASVKLEGTSISSQYELSIPELFAVYKKCATLGIRNTSELIGFGKAIAYQRNENPKDPRQYAIEHLIEVTIGRIPQTR